MNRIYISTGANLGNPSKQLAKASILLEERLGPLIRASSIFTSEGWGVKDQPLYFNQALIFDTSNGKERCLEICQDIENELGRVRLEKWGARIIDIDILYFNQEIFESNTLTVPHPLIQYRNFVLIPLAEIAADYIHPTLLKNNLQLMQESPDKLIVSKLKQPTMSYSIINPEVINRSMMGKPNVVKQFIEMYIYQSPIDFATLENNLKKGNTRDIGDSAHHIKPTMEYIGASTLRLAFQDLENMGKEGFEIEEIRNKFNEIKPKFELMIEELKSFSNEIDSSFNNNSDS